MSTYLKIQAYVKARYGFEPKTCWIADAKEKCGIPVREAWNRQPGRRKHPCPENKLPAIKDAFEHFGLLKRR